MDRSIPEDLIKRIQGTANIVDIIGERVVLKKAGRNHVGLCPFHAEKTPSFSVSPEKQMYYCFGCHTGGDVFNFLMQQEGLSFIEAVRSVAARCGIEVPNERLTAEQHRQLTEKDQLFQINAVAGVFFQQVLNDKQRGSKAMSYLVGRGMTRAMIEGFQLGYAPAGWDGLLNHLRSRKIDPLLAVKGGLVVPRKEGSGFYDRFRDRVMFPIHDASQRIVGFGGRVMGQDLPKYLNSPETPIYNKRRSLYGIHRARQMARAEGRVFLVEGYFDVLALHLNGIANAVATLGTALTAEHARMLKGLVGDGEVILVYDSDQAGITAARRSIAVFETEALNARILVLPKGEDPDSYLKTHGPDEFLGLSSNALSFIPFLIEWAVAQYGLSVEGKVKVVNFILDHLADVRDSVARALYVRDLAERIGIAEAAILEKVRQTGGTPAFTPDPHTDNSGFAGIKPQQRLELQMVAMMLRFPSVTEAIVSKNYLEAFEDTTLKNIARTILDKSLSGNEGANELMATVKDRVYRNLMAKLFMTERQWDRHDSERLLKQFENRLKRRNSADLQRQIEAAEKNGDFELLTRLLRNKQRQAGRGLTH